MKYTTLKAVPGRSSKDLPRALEAGLKRMGLSRTLTTDITGRKLMAAMDRMPDDTEVTFDFNRIVLVRVEVHRTLTLKGLYMVRSRKIREPKPVKKTTAKKTVKKASRKPARKSSKKPTK